MIERKLEYLAPGATEPVTIHVRIGLPEPVPETERTYQSTLSIEGFDQPFCAPFFQVDPLGAVLAAAAIAPSTLFERAKGGRLTWLGAMEDLGFPLLGPPTHYWWFRPANGGEPRSLSISIHPPEKIDGQWACLLTFTSEGFDERWIKADTWAKALERAAAAVPDRLQEYVDMAGGGSLEDMMGPPGDE
jgi:hypothetical protein